MRGLYNYMAAPLLGPSDALGYSHSRWLAKWNSL